MALTFSSIVKFAAFRPLENAQQASVYKYNQDFEEHSLRVMDKISLNNSIADLCNKAYSELRGQGEYMTSSTAEKTDEKNVYWTPESTAERIMDHIKNREKEIASSAQCIKDAIDKGLEDARTALGGTLPASSYETYTAVQEQIDLWVERATLSKGYF